jgi:hypothetical protein
MSRGRWRVWGWVVALVALAVLAQAGSPGFPLPAVAQALTRRVQATLHPTQPAGAVGGPTIHASPVALADIPADYLAYYHHAQATCPQLDWQILAAIGKVESNHGRSHAPGVRSGLNRYGCCAGPMQFNLTNGPPSTWTSFAHPGDNPYDPADAIPAAARKLCANGLREPPTGGRDPCPQVRGPANLHRALKRYNNACWYVHEITTIATRYTTTPPPTASADPYAASLARNPRITTTRSHGCTPATDLASGRLDLRVQALLAALTQHWRVRISCAHTGHSRYVKGTRRVSNHTVWRAIDLDRINNQPVTKTNPTARALAVWLDRLDGPLRPAEVGSPWPLGHRPYFSDEGHQQHIHIGYSYDPATA